MNDLAPQRVALVTGGAVRLGRAIALGLAEAGYNLVISYHRSSDEAVAVVEEARAMGRRCEAIGLDLADASAAEALVHAVAATYGRLDVLVNSAATFDDTPLMDVDAERWDETMALNLRAPHLLVRAAAALLEKSRGCVVNLVDLAALQPWTGHPQHAVSKAGLDHLTRIQARLLAPHVRVNAIAPGAVLPPNDWPESRVRALAEQTPLRRIGSPRDVVGAVLYLAGAEYVTGHTLVVDGGRILGH